MPAPKRKAPSKAKSSKGSTHSVKIANKKTNKSKRKKFRTESQIRRDKKAQEAKENPAARKKAKDTKKGKAPVQAPIREEVQINEDDIKFFSKRDEYLAGFMKSSKSLATDQPAQKKSKKERKKEEAEKKKKEGAKKQDEAADADAGEDGEDGDEESDNEADYESRPRRAAWDEKKKGERLPVKTLDGKLQTIKPEEESEDELEDDLVDIRDWAGARDSDDDEDGSEDGSDYDEDEDEDEEDEEEKKEQKAPTPEDEGILQQKRQARINRLRKRIAELADSILQQPEAKINELTELEELYNDPELVIRQLTLLSVLQVFVDIMPGYRIRLPTQAELKQKATKEVKDLRKFESSLLSGYHRFVVHLIACMQPLRTSLYGTARKAKAKPPFQLSSPEAQQAITAVKCLTKLVERAFHFNYAKDVILAVLPLINHREEEVGDLVYRAVCAVFAADKSGNAAVEIMRVMARLAKDKLRVVTARMLRSFLKLRLSYHVIHHEDNSKNKKKGKKAKKDEVDKQLDKDLEQVEAEVGIEQKKRVQVELMNLVFSTYFRILKQSSQSPLLPIVLEGLAKFASLINIELVVDLIQVMKDLVAKSKLSVSSVLHCILAAFQTLAGPGQALNIEVKDFYIHLYDAMHKFGQPANYEHIPLLFSCLEIMFLKRRVLSIELVAAYVHRIAALSVNVLPHHSMACLQMIRYLIDKYPRCQQLLDNETTPTGLFRPDLEDPEHCNPFAATAWQLSLHTMSYHPMLAKLATLLLSGQEFPMSVIRMSPVELLDEYDISNGGFNPPVQPPPSFKGEKSK